MTFDEAEKVFNSWRSYVEISDKLSKIFSKLPESFLPYPKDISEEALNIMAERYWNNGDKETSKAIQTIQATLCEYVKDEEALEQMARALDLTVKHPDLKQTILEVLKECKDSWLKQTYL
jgi:hypothetical protein